MSNDIIPIEESRIGWVPGRPVETSPPGSDKLISILIVDDEPKNLMVLESILNERDYRLVRAQSADEALLALVAEEFALLILDIRMPGMTGFELAQMVKERKKTACVPIIFLTAYYNEDQHIIAGYETGAVDYLHKPVNPAILRSKVAMFAELHRKNRELETVNRILLAEVAERGRVEERLRELNETLEARVAERTRSLNSAEIELRDADRRKDEFLATLAHELRNPLAPIATGLEILKRGTDADSSLIIRDVMERQLTHLVRLVDDLLDVARINHGKIELKKSRITIQSVLDNAIEMSRPVIDIAKHRLVVNRPEEPLWIDGDLTRLAQVVGNLLHNSVKYTPEGGLIQITAVEENGQAVIRVEDNGVGIQPEMLPKIFDLFGQVNRTVNLAKGGLGIGLSLALKLVEMHAGSIQADSQGINNGSVFTIRLPLAEKLRSAAVSGRRASPSHLASSLRILVVDDNVDAAESLGMLLRTRGHSVSLAYNGQDAISVALDRRPQIVFLDIGLPDMDGYEVCRQLRTREEMTEAVFVALTGWGAERDKDLALDAGFTRHLVKPASFELVESILGSVHVNDDDSS